jgi:hypothetical protein
MLLRGVVARSFRLPPPPSGLVWAYSERASIAGNVLTGTGTNRGHGVTADPLPATAVYFEIEMGNCATNTDRNGVGVWQIVGGAPPGAWPPDSAGVGQFFGEESFGIFSNGESSLFALYNADWAGNIPTPIDTDYPVYRIGIASNGAGRLWARQVVPGGSGDYFGSSSAPPSGDPTVTLTSGDDLYICASVGFGSPAGTATLIAPANHYGTPPSGYTAI